MGIYTCNPMVYELSKYVSPATFAANSYYMNDFDQHNGSDMVPGEIKFYLANAFLNSLKTRDWQLLRSILTEDASWTLPGGSLISGRADGVEAIIRKAQRIVSFQLLFRLDYILYGLNGMALSLHKTAIRGEMKLDETWITACDLQAGRIAAIDTYLPDIEFLDAFFREEA